MPKVLITKDLFASLQKKFGDSQTQQFLDLFASLEDNPHKGDALGSVGGVVIKELKHKKFRFYFLTDGHVLKFGSPDELATMIIKFVKFSNKKDQEATIKSIKDVLKSLGFDGF